MKTVNQKQLWEALAKENPRYYINTDFGRRITESQFKQSGETAYSRLIVNDGLIWSRDSIVDFGCGTGRLTEFMARDFKKVIGVDISPTMIAQGKTRLQTLKNVEFLEIDGQSLPLPNNSVEVVFSYLVFQHIKNRKMVETAFGEIFRVLKPGGIFKTLLRSDKQKDMSRWWSGVEYNPEASRLLAEKIGFKILKIEPVERHTYWLWLQK